MDVDTASKDSRLLAYRMLWMVSELGAENKKERVTKTTLGFIFKIHKLRLLSKLCIILCKNSEGEQKDLSIKFVLLQNPYKWRVYNLHTVHAPL